jgi:hypothetical protein
MLAERLGLQHHALTDGGPYLHSNCRSIVWRTEGLSSFADTTSLRYHSVLKNHLDIVLTGFLAEYSGSHTWPQLLMTRSRKAAIDAIFSRYVESRLPIARRIFTRDFLKTAEEELRNSFLESFEGISNNHPLNIADAWNVVNLQPLSTFHSTSVDRYVFEVRSPHMDFELVQFLLSIPPLQRLEQRIYKKMIAYSFPSIRNVPCTNSGLVINPHFVAEYSQMVLRFAGRKGLSVLSGFLPGERTSLGREFRNLADDFRAEPELISGLLRPLMKNGILPSVIFNHNGIEQIIAEHYEYGKSFESVLARLISLGIATRYFVEDDFTEVPDLLRS